MHSLLRRQIKHHLGEGKIPDEFSRLLNAIDQTYQQNDQDRELLERSLELSSQELNERYEGLDQQLRINEAAKKDLENTLSLLDATFNATEEGILVVDRSGRVVKFNSVFAKIWGLPQHLLDSGDDDAMLDAALSKVADPEAFITKVRALYSAPLAESVDIVELRDGRILERFTRPQMLQNECIGRVWFFRDITDKKAAAANLELARRVFEVSSQGILITDAHFQIVDVNRSLCEMLNRPPEELLGHPLQRIEDANNESLFNESFMAHIKSKGEWWGELFSLPTNQDSRQVIWIGFSVARNSNGEISNYVGVCSDITKLKDVEDKLQQLAYYDQLTGLPNRRLFKESVEIRISKTRKTRRVPRKIALLYLDLDRFKFINDSLGHLAGDQLLVRVSERIRNEIRSHDLVSRQGGDEFTIALFDIENESIINDVATRIIGSLRKPFHVKGQELYIGASIGVCVIPDHASNFEDAVRKADTAMYLAKASGKGRYSFWDTQIQTAMESRIVVEVELREAIRQGQLQVYYQPILDCFSRKPVALEALLRWRHPRRGIVSPDTFVLIAEEIGLMVELENWLIEEVCRQIHAWRDDGLALLPVSINVSAQHLGDSRLEQQIVSALQRFDISPELLTIEITESTAMSEPRETVNVLQGLRTRGVHSAIDDFGTGYSSLSYLKQLPVDTLKIDVSFVRDLSTDPNDRDIAKAIVDLGHSLLMKIIAEGVETEAQLEILRAMGCDKVQGWLFAKAATAAETMEYIASTGDQSKPRGQSATNLRAI